MTKRHCKDEAQNNSCLYILTIYLTLLVTILPAIPLNIRLDLSKNVKPESMELSIFESGFSEIYSDQVFQEKHAFDTMGQLTFDYSPSENTRLEISGPGILRTSYPWPEDAAQPNKEAVFEIAPGSQINLTIKDEETGSAIPNVVIGPVLLQAPSSSKIDENSYPFFSLSNETGKAILYGVQPELSYKAICWAPGYQRNSVSLISISPSEITLIPGGETLSGIVLGRKSQQPMPAALVNVYSEEHGLYFKWRTDEEGEFQIPGLPSGQIQLTVSSLLDGTSQPTEILIQKGITPPQWTLFCPEGINVSGTLQDVETLMGIPGAWMEIASEGVRTDPLGRFQFPILHGPWPRHLIVEHPEYIFDTADQTLDHYPINGHDGIDLEQVILKVRRIRFLELLGSYANQDETGMALDIFDLSEEEKTTATHHRIKSLPTKFSLQSAGDRLIWLRNNTTLSSKLHFVYTSQDQTTTTLNLEIGPSSQVNGSFFDKNNPDFTQFPSYKLNLKTDSDQYGFEVPITSLTTQPDGQFNFPCLPSGWFILEYQRTDKSTGLMKQSIYLEEGEAKTVSLDIQQGMPFKGIVVDENAVPLPEIPLEIYATKTDGSSYHHQVMSKSDGSFVFNDLGGEIASKLSVQHQQYQPVFIDTIPLPQEEYLVVLEHRGGITVQLEASEYALTTARAQILEGNLSPAPQGGLHWFSNLVTEESFAGKEKTTIFPKVSGRMRLAVYADQQWAVSPPFQWDPTDERLEVSMKTGLSAGLTVTLPNEDFTDEQSSWEAVMLNTTLLEDQAQTEFIGELSPPNKFEFNTIPAGDYILLINAPNDRSIAQAGIALENNQHKELEVSMEFKTFDLYGTIVDGGEDASPISGCNVKLYYADVPESEMIAEETSNSSGQFEFPALEVTHNYTLILEKADHQKTFNLIPPQNQAEMVQEFQLPKLVTVQFELTEKLQKKIGTNSAVPVILFPKQGGNPIQLKTDEISSQLEIESGTYVVVWGEERVGSIEVPESKKIVYLSLPAL